MKHYSNSLDQIAYKLRKNIIDMLVISVLKMRNLSKMEMDIVVL